MTGGDPNADINARAAAIFAAIPSGPSRCTEGPWTPAA
jgi:hypothetical protein